MLSRRKIALWICPELAVPAHPQAFAGLPKSRSAEGFLQAEYLRELDRVFTAHTGVTLNHKNAPDYTGSLYRWNATRPTIRKRAIDALIRIRRNPSAGVNTSTTAFPARCYFDAIWPADLEWPSDIPRPSVSGRAA